MLRIRQIRLLAAAACIATLVGCASATAASQPLASEDFMIASNEPGISLSQHSLQILSALHAREQLLVAFDRMPEPQLKTLFLLCDRESSQHMLDFDNAVRCSMVNEALLKRSFGGDFGALLAWWRVHRGPRPDSAK